MPLPQILTSGKPTVILICIIIFLVLFPPVHSPALADEETIPSEVYLGVMATTPSRLEEPVEEVSGSISLITQPEIEAQNPVAVTEVLRDLPGVSLQESGTMGESATLTLRGTEPSQTLILLDGIRLNSPFRGGFDLGNLMIDEISQVEMVRGAQSSLYGSEAMGGVVNLKSRRGKGPMELVYTQGAGSEKTFREILSASGGDSSLDYALTLSRTDTDGQFDHDRFGASTLAGQLGLPIRESGRLGLLYRIQNDHKELATDIIPVSDDAVQVVFDENNEIKRKFFFHSIQYLDRMTSWLELSWKAAVVDTALNWDNPEDPGSASPSSYFEDTDTRTFLLDLQQNLHVSDSDTLSFGMERTRDIVNSEIVAFDFPFPVDESRQNTAYYLQNLFKWEKRFVLQAGVRVDDNESFGTVTNPKVSTAYEFKSTGTKLRGSWGTGFRAPTIQELFFPIFGNPELDPEKSRGWETGVQQKILGETVILDVAYFRIDYEDLIQKSPTGVANIGEARTQGVESALQIHPFSVLTVKANYTYLDAEDKVTDEELPFRPRHQGNISLLYAPTVSFVANMDINMVGSQALSADFILLDGSRLQGHSPGYTRVDLSATYHLFGRFFSLRETRFFVKVLNLFDRDYQQVPGFPAPGVSFLAGLSAQF